jgi:hypothetical protein
MKTRPKHELSEPVELGSVRIAPTVELAGLAELSVLDEHDDQLDAIVRIAATVRAEDAARDHVNAMRDKAVGGASADGHGRTELPRRR